MRSGDYRVPIVLQRPVDLANASGAVTRTYQVAGTAFAAIRLLNHFERFDGAQRFSSRTYEVRLRPVAGLAGEWRVVAGSRVFRVLSVADTDLRGREQVCRAEEEGA